MEMKKILVVDDDRGLRRMMGAYLRASGYATVEAGDGSEALDVLDAQNDIGAVVTDIQMPIINGVGLVKVMHQQGRGLPTVVISGRIQEYRDLFPSNYEPGIVFFQKPCSMNDLCATVEQMYPLR